MNQRRIEWSLASVLVLLVIVFFAPLIVGARERPDAGRPSATERLCERLSIIVGRLPIALPEICVPPPPPPPAPEGMVLISEIAWMGSIVDGVSDTNAEWIELMNTGDTAIDISGWGLFAVDGNPGNVLASCENPVIPANGFFLLVRGTDSAYGVPADCTYPGGVGVNNLGNTGEDLDLRDAGGELKDNLPAADGGWPGGDNGTKETLQRTSSETWGTFAPTPGAPAPTP